jgi:peptide-methionine (S)-S-oxide reductase
MEEIYLAGGCLWGVQEFVRHLPGVLRTEAGRANGRTHHDTQGEYDGYAECVKTWFDPQQITVEALLGQFFEFIDPYSLNQQGNDVGEKYRTGVYSLNPKHLEKVTNWIQQRDDSPRVVVEVGPLTNYVRSDDEHQDRLTRHPEDACKLR